MSTRASFDRVLLLVIDGVGAGALPDAASYGDLGANTIGNLAHALKQQHGRTLKLPNMAALGYGNITTIEGTPPVAANQNKGAYGCAHEKSSGKDTTSGHWELMGLVVKKPFHTYPTGFPEEIVERWIKENDLPGILGNKTASGTGVLEELGEEHIRSGKPILYTSADSVWQVAASEEHFGLERLYKICKSARVLCDDLGISRVIARPFVGNPAQGQPFKRTYNRKDYAQQPFGRTYLDELESRKIPILGIGKIQSIYAKRGVPLSIETHGNTHGFETVLAQLDQFRTGLIFVNLIDFDMQYGHRRDVVGFADAMEEFDRVLPEIQKRMNERDLLLIVADHGNDPTHTGSDHTREQIPILAWTPAQKPVGLTNLGTRSTFADVGATAAHALLGAPLKVTEIAGTSFLQQLEIL